MVMIRNEKGQFIKGHKPLRAKKKALEIVSWICVGCGIKTEKKYEEVWGRQSLKYCSIECVYKNNPRKGVKLLDSTKKKLSEQKVGAKNPSWAGGVTPFRVKLRNTPEYKIWRKAIYERDDYTCLICKKRGGRLEADHIIPYMKDKEKLLDVDNGQTLCRACHLKKTTKEMKANWVNQYGRA